MSDTVETAEGAREPSVERRLAARQHPPLLHTNGSAQVSVNSSTIGGAWKAAVDLSSGDVCIGMLTVASPYARGTVFSSGCSHSELSFMNIDGLRNWLEAQIPRPDHDGAYASMVDPKEVAEVANLPWFKHLSALSAGRAEVANDGVLWALIGWRNRAEEEVDRKRLAPSIRVLAHCAMSYNDNTRRERRLQILEGMIDELAPALMLVSGTAQVFWTNYRAELILAQRRLLVRNGNNMLASRTPSNTVALRQAISDVIALTPRTDEENDRYFLMPREDGGEEVIVLRPVSGRNALEGNRAVMVIVPQDDMLALVGKLVSLYGLIPSEARFVSAIIQGGSAAHAAIQLGITEQTAKTYMKRIYAKLGIGSQLELGMLFASLAPPLRSAQRAMPSMQTHIATP
jgi:DNA-binding CsgD family transcriptional regulator